MLLQLLLSLAGLLLLGFAMPLARLYPAPASVLLVVLIAILVRAAVGLLTVDR